MKITDETLIKSLIQGASSSKAESSGLNFAETLAKTVSKGSGEDLALQKNGGVSELGETVSAGRILSAGLSSQIGPVEKTLGLLDRYASALADPNQNLKQVSPLVLELKQAAENLKKTSQALPTGHAAREIIDRTAIMAAVEVEKFNRGDYI